MAQAPLWEACEHFGARRAVEGMQCLSADRLKSALEKAVGETASHFGVTRSRIERVMDRDQVSAIVSQLREHQPACEQMARSHGESLTSFVVERVTISAGAVAYLSALANRFSDDAFIADPVRRLGGLVAQWDELLEGFGDRLDADATLGSARRRKLATRTAIVAAVAVAMGAAAAWAGWSYFVVQGSQRRLQHTLEAPDPCVTAAMTDLRHARVDQLSAMEKRRRQCDAIALRHAYEQACAELAARMEAGRLEEADSAIAGDTAPLLRRMVSGALAPADLVAGPGALPCQDTASGPRFWTVLARIAAGSASLWATADQVSPQLAALLGTPELSLSNASREALTSRAEASARRAVVVGLPEALDKARALCRLQSDLHVPWERGCKAIDRLSAGK